MHEVKHLHLAIHMKRSIDLVLRSSTLWLLLLLDQIHVGPLSSSLKGLIEGLTYLQRGLLGRAILRSDEVSDFADHGFVAHAYHDTHTSALNDQRAVEGHVPGMQGILLTLLLVRVVVGTNLDWMRLA